MSSEQIILMKGIRKIYPDGTIALRGVDFSVNRGEIHGLLGENGAGKTTLMNILYGLIPPTSGEIYLRGEKVEIKSPKEAMENGIGMVHQHFMLIPTFSALDNIILGKEPLSGPLTVDRKSARKEIEMLMEETGLKVDLDTAVENLPVGIQQRIEILKMLYKKAEILILDEPTAVLTPIEVKELFSFLRKMRDSGKTIIFITHKLKEVKAIADRVTVLRRGEVVGVRDVKDVEIPELARMMVGRDIKMKIEKKPPSLGEEVLIVRDLWVRDDRGREAVRGLSFSVRSGEIFGIAGVEGNGQSELVEAICGLRKVDRGSIILCGVDVTGMNPMKLYSLGLGHIPEDRHKWGIILDFSVEENAIVGVHRSRKFLNSIGLMNGREIFKWTDKIVKDFNVETMSLKTPARSLSGGNQQKLIVGRELSKSPRVIVASQPTRGLDVAATEYIRDLLLRMRDEGRAILLVSADLDEVMGLSDRMAVMYEGRFTGIVDPERVSEEQVGMMMGGISIGGIS
ncbi:MAG: ABC transporter ATP-binding protein [Candidatus Methanodesulfokora washburnensis]